MPFLVMFMAMGVGTSLVACGGSKTPSATTPAAQKELTGIEIATPPTKVEYADGENFDPAGMVVNALYSDSSKEAVTDYTYSPKTLKFGDTKVTVTYKRMKATVDVTVKETLVTGLELNVASMDLQVNEKKQIVATVLPENASNKNVTYASGNEAVATVDDKGLVTATGIGQATITVSTVGKNASNEVISKTIAVTVQATATTGIEIDVDDITLKVGEEKQIGVTVLPTNASDKAVSFSSSDTSVASVSDVGLVKALATGESTITVSTHATGADGNPFTASFVVTVVDVSTKYIVAFRNTDGTLIQGYTEGELEVGEIPQFTKGAPRKASDAEGVYVFRGFDKEILPYAVSSEEITYTAVYQKRSYTITAMSLELVGEKLVYSVTGTSVADNPEITLRSMIKGGSWTTSDIKQMEDLSYNSDGSWVVKADLLDPDNDFLKNSLNTPFIGKFKFNGGSDEDLKALVRNDAKRYRHTADGTVVEVNTLADDWDGVTGLEDLPQEFQDAIPAPTWDGLNIDFQETVVEVNGLEYKMYANADTWNCVSLIVKKAGAIDVEVTPQRADLEQIDGKPYYVVSGSYKGDVTIDQLQKAYGIDFQRHANLNGDGRWDYLEFDDQGTRKYSFDKAVSSIDTTAHTYVAKFLIDITAFPAFVETVPVVFLIHTQLNGASADNMKIDAGETTFTIGQYNYSILKNSDTWTIACLQIQAVE